MTMLKIAAGRFRFTARLETGLAPRTCAAFLGMLPLAQKLLHVRWSGEGCWIPLGDADFGLSPENATSYPAPGQCIFYPGGPSETEILLAYGAVHFTGKVGPLAGNHFMTVVEGNANLPELGRDTLWQGAQDVTFGLANN